MSSVSWNIYKHVNNTTAEPETEFQLLLRKYTKSSSSHTMATVLVEFHYISSSFKWPIYFSIDSKCRVFFIAVARVLIRVEVN